MMLKRLFVLAVALGLGLVSLSLVQSAGVEKVNAERIAKLVEQLGSGSFTEREEATKALDQIGAPALEALKKAAQSSDTEVRKRAGELVQKISKRAQSEKILAPTKIQLVYKETPVEEAVADFSRKSAYSIVLAGDTSKLSDRKVTIDTGETTFWQAFDQFCEKAGLVEAAMQNMPWGPVPPLGAPAIPKGGVKPPPPLRAPAKGAAAPGAAPGRAAVAVAVADAVQAVAQPDPAKPAPAVPPAAKPGVKILPAPAPGAGPGAMPIRPGWGSNGQLVLMDGKPETLPTCYSGAVRIRALPPNTQVFGVPKQENEIVFALDVLSEPKIQWQFTQNVQIDKAIDDNEQHLSQSVAPIGPGGVRGGPPAGVGGGVKPMIAIQPGWGMSYGRQVALRLKAGDKPSKLLKELKGSITAQVLAPAEPLITVDNILKAAKKTVKGQHGGSIKVLEVKREEDGAIEIRVQVENPPAVWPAQNWRGGGGIGVPVPIPPPPAPAPVPAKRAAGAARLQLAVAEIAAVQAAGAAGTAPAAVVVGRANAGMAVQHSYNGLALYDDKGKAFELAGAANVFTVIGGPVIGQDYILTFKPAKGQGDPAKLVFSGTRPVTVDVPFTLKDVPLPETKAE